MADHVILQPKIYFHTKNKSAISLKSLLMGFVKLFKGLYLLRGRCGVLCNSDFLPIACRHELFEIRPQNNTILSDFACAGILWNLFFISS
jgi:hypothetical protein